MYQSPFKLYTTYTEEVARAAAEALDNEVFKAAYSVGVTVDKEELLRALRYDRDQYNRGFNDGIMAAADELVRCKDCKWFRPNSTTLGKHCSCSGMVVEDNDFCSYGERRNEDEDYQTEF